MSSKSSEDDAFGIFVIILLFLVISGFGHFVWGIIYGDNQLKIFYTVSGFLSFILSLSLAIINNKSIKSSLTIALITSIITLSATGGLDTYKDIITSWGIAYLVIFWIIHTFVLLIIFGVLSDEWSSDDLMSGFFISLIITTGVLICIYTNSIIDVFIKIGGGACIILVISLAIGPTVTKYYEKKKEERKAYEEKKEYLIRRMNEILKRG